MLMTAIIELPKSKLNSALQSAAETSRRGSCEQSGRARERCSRRAVQLDSGAGVQIRRTVGLNN